MTRKKTAQSPIDPVSFFRSSLTVRSPSGSVMAVTIEAHRSALDKLSEYRRMLFKNFKIATSQRLLRTFDGTNQSSPPCVSANISTLRLAVDGGFSEDPMLRIPYERPSHSCPNLPLENCLTSRCSKCGSVQFFIPTTQRTCP